jgi:hypothetical protein
LACVPFPHPGAPSKTIRILVSRNDLTEVSGPMPGTLSDATGNGLQGQFD